MSGTAPAAQRMHWASAETLVAAARLAEDGELPPPAELRSRILKGLQQMAARCRAAGISDEDTAEARYALVAFIDEQVLRSNWSGRSEWMTNPLQHQLYRESAAGENFFKRLRALLRKPVASPALVVFHFCLALGFVGARSETRAGENARSYLAAIRPRLIGASTEALSPHALPALRPANPRQDRSFLVALAAASGLIVALGLGLMSFSLNRAIARAEQDLEGVPGRPPIVGALGR